MYDPHISITYVILYTYITKLHTAHFPELRDGLVGRLWLQKHLCQGHFFTAKYTVLRPGSPEPSYNFIARHLEYISTAFA